MTNPARRTGNRAFRKALPLLVPFALLLSGCHGSPSSTVAAAPSAGWTPDPALLSRLGPEVQMDGFSIRPPQNCTFMETTAENDQNTLVRYKWRQEHPNGSALVFSVHIGRAKPGYALEPDVVASLQALTDHNGADYQNYVHSSLETGAVNGVSFARVYWKGMSPPDSPQQHGLFYLTGTKSVNITVHGTDSEPYSAETLPICEAAALTFHLR